MNEYEIYSAYCLITSEQDPKTYQQAVNSDNWKMAMQKELQAHEKQKTWEEAELPNGKNAIETKWVFRTKEDGTKKARIVARGYQIEEENPFDALYAPVARMATIRIFLSHALQENWKIKQLDIPAAFLNGQLESEV